jgi:Ni/Co efflux regulator RcnB
MKRLILSIAALAGALAATPPDGSALAQGRGRGAERQERGPDRPRGEGRRWDERPRDTRPTLGYERRDDRRGRWDADEAPRYRDRRDRWDDDVRSEPPRRRGFVPDGYRGAVVEDYRRYRLRPPPHGYAWVRMGDGFALISLDDGQIFDRVR